MLNRKKNPFKEYIKNVLKYTPKDMVVYEQALLHRSVSGNGLNGVKTNNERLEYLGDAVLSAIIADFLYKKYPFADEGFLTSLRSRIVSRSHLGKLAHKMGLDAYIKKNDQNSSLSRSISGDAFEAFVGAIFLDKGYLFARKIIVNLILDVYVDLNTIEKEDTNYKGRLLTWSQKRKRQAEYKVVKEVKERHAQKQYVVHLFVDGEFVSEGCSFNIKSAQQQAAMYACERLNI
ncbi:MAG: ribonuclease III [Lentimicrobiaceae bacterium]|nr:ribonuclease III [Lentimicrobiaceae bacterium]